MWVMTCGLQAALFGWVIAAAPPVDCPLRKFIFSRSVALLPKEANARAIHEALQLDDCNAPSPPYIHRDKHAQCTISDPAPIQLHVSPTGSDGNDGSQRAPLATVHAARDALRSRRRADARADVILHRGTHRLQQTLGLGVLDGDTRYVACEEDRGAVILSGGESLTLKFRREDSGAAWSADTPASLHDIEQLFVDVGDGLSGVVGHRLPWAREPNGNAEVDLQPVGYALAQDNPLGEQPAPAGAGPYTPLRAAHPLRNSSFFPGWGYDLDPRRPGTGYVELHRGGSAAIYADGLDWWNQTLPRGVRWSATNGSSHGFNVSALNASGWPVHPRPRPWLHAMHHAEWGNHVWRIEAVDVPNRTFTLGEGGWQEGRYIAIDKNPFYVEGVRAALDRPGEWWHDEAGRVLYLIPNETLAPGVTSFEQTVTVPQLEVLINVSSGEADGAGRQQAVAGLIFEGLTFTHTRRTLLAPYVVPSPGDWSLHPGGAVTVHGSAQDVTIRRNAFNRTGGNAIALIGDVQSAVIEANDFELLGDSAIVLIGRIGGLGNNGSDAAMGPSPSYPRDTQIHHNHVHELGVWGKQSSALFQAITCRTNFSSNVLYSGPRAGININDGFCGGHRIASNVLFNWVRETQDHGPINTWDRATYIQPDGTLYPQWVHLERNLIMNGPSPNRDLGNLFPAVDNDDGSAFYYIASNVVAYGGFKNFLGNDKVWRANLILYPDGRTVGSGNGPCVMAWGGANEVYENNTCVTRADGSPGVDPYPWGPEGGGCSYSNESLRPILLHLKGTNRYLSPTAGYNPVCGQSLAGLQAIGQELGSTTGPVPDPDTLIEMARQVLLG